MKNFSPLAIQIPSPMSSLRSQLTSTPSPGPAPSEPNVGSDSGIVVPEGVWIALAILMLGALTLWGIYRYLNAWRKDYVKASNRTSKSGGSMIADYISGSVTIAPSALAKAGTPHGELRIEGPNELIVAAPATIRAFVGNEPVEVSWKTEGPVSCDRTSGSEASVTATETGSITLKAVYEGREATATFKAKESTRQASSAFPLAGEGYAGITVAILSVTVGGALTAVGVLPAAALATLLGTVVSYFFAQRAR